MYDVSHYTYHVQWSPEDEAFIARVAEFKSLAAHSEVSQEAALGELKEVVRVVLEDLASSNEPIPAPHALKEYSGRFNVRMAPDLHRELAAEAEHQNVSLNHLVVTKLSRGYGLSAHRTK